MIGLLRAEWLKIRSVRSTYWIFAAVAAFVCLATWVAWYGAGAEGGIPLEYRADFALSPQTQLAADVIGLCLAILGTLAITSEHSTGMIRTTFAAVPRRRAVVAAKAVVLAGVAAVTAPVSLFSTYFVTRAILDHRPLPGQALPAVSEHLPALLAMCLAVVVYTLLGLGLAIVLRSAVAAIATFVVLWYVLPMVAGNLPAPWNDRIGSFLPGALPGQLAGTGNEHDVFGALLPPVAALAVMAAYVAVPLTAACWLITRRDA